MRGSLVSDDVRQAQRDARDAGGGEIGYGFTLLVGQLCVSLVASRHHR